MGMGNQSFSSSITSFSSVGVIEYSPNSESKEFQDATPSSLRMSLISILPYQFITILQGIPCVNDSST
jgi:hypothetical protein